MTLLSSVYQVGMLVYSESQGVGYGMLQGGHASIQNLMFKVGMLVFRVTRSLIRNASRWAC